MTGPQAAWRKALADGRLLFQRSRASGQVFFPPRLAEPGIGDRDWDWVDAPTLGTIYSLTVIPARSGAERPARSGAERVVALVDFDGGGRMMGNVLGLDPGDIRIGMRVAVRIDDTAETVRVVFDASKARS